MGWVLNSLSIPINNIAGGKGQGEEETEGKAVKDRSVPVVLSASELTNNIWVQVPLHYNGRNRGGLGGGIGVQEGCRRRGRSGCLLSEHHYHLRAPASHLPTLLIVF